MSEPPKKARYSLKLLRREFLTAAVMLGSSLPLDSIARAAPASGEDALRSITALSKAEAAALKLAARIMLPEQLPADGPSFDDVVANLARFLSFADETTFAALREQLRLLGSFAFVAEEHIAELQQFVSKQLRQRGFSAVKNALDSLHKVAVLGYYSHAKSYRRLGYRPLDVPQQPGTPLKITPRASSEVFDVAIIGSGVAGSVLAARLTAAGKRVVVLESGPYVPEATITSDELKWLASLERGSGLQLANVDAPYVQSARSFPILQGHCVGGGGVINNAVCFQMPARRIDQWHGLGFPVSTEALRAAYTTTGGEIRVKPVSEAVTDKTKNINRSMMFMTELFGQPKTPSITDPPTPGFYECLVNLEGCVGCGLCNTGCRWERKVNALQVYLKAALEHEGGQRCQLVADTKVEEIAVTRAAAGAAGRVSELWVRDHRSGERYRVRAHEYVVCAGAVHTPALLLGSRELRAQAHKLPIGERLSAHLVSPVLGFVDEPIHEQPSLQLTHYYVPENPDDGFMIENLYNPPGQAAVVMAGYGQLHFDRMQKYKSTLLVGAVVPTIANGRVELRADGRPSIVHPLAENELIRLRHALALIARGMLRGSDQGVKPSEVIVGIAGGGFVMKSEATVDRLEKWLTSFDQVALSTGHPQGGSAMSEDPKIGVVDAEFRVRGFANLRVCDASLFPMAAGVNPQWTVMALAHCCADVMNG